MGEGGADNRKDAGTPALSDINLRFKLLAVIGGLTILPVFFVASYTASSYDRLLNEAFLSQLPQEIVAGERDIRLSLMLLIAVLLGLAAGALVFIDQHFIEPIKRLRAWLHSARVKSFVEADSAPNSTRSDEIGALSTEMEDAVKYFRDVRDRETAISREKDEFISVAAHHLRTPMTELRWGFETIDRMGAKDQKIVMEKLRSTTMRMVDLVNDLLDVARIEEGKFGFEFRMIELGALVRDITESFRLMAEHKQLTLEYSGPAKAQAFADPSRIELALANLISNALNYTPSGSVKVTLAKDGQKYRISVQDTGIGLRDDEKPRLFLKFFRGEEARRISPDGSGLGLYIVKNIVERHGGTLDMKTTLGKGTKFSFTVPLEKTAVPDVSLEKLLGTEPVR